MTVDRLLQLPVPELLMLYAEHLTRAADARHEATTTEIRRAEWVSAEIATLRGAGATKTDSDKAAHADTKHRRFQHEVAAAQLRADLAERDARVTAFVIRHRLAETAQPQVATGTLPLPGEIP